MADGTYNFKIDQGSTFERTLTFTEDDNVTPRDFTGYTWRMQIRKYLSDTVVLIELTSENGRIDISNQDTGVVVLNISATDTTDLDFSNAVYDLESVNGAIVQRELKGKVKLSKEVTR